MSDNVQSGRKLGLFGRISQFFLRQRLRMAARASYGYRQKAIDLLKKYRDVAQDMLVQDLEGEPRDSRYRMDIPSLLGMIGGKKAEDACLRLISDIQEAGPVRRNAVNAIAQMGLAGKSPFFDALISCVHETTDYVEFDSAKVLCQTKRREVIPHVVAYLKACPDILRYGVEKALDGTVNWITSEEAAGLAPVLIQAYRNGDVRIKEFVVQYMGKLAAAQFADQLQEALEEKQGLVSHYAEQSLRVVAEKHGLKKHLNHFATIDKRREDAQRDVEKLRRTLKRLYAEDARELRHKICVGMSLAEVKRVLGKPSHHISGGAILGMFGSVSGSADAMSSLSQQQYYIWNRPEGEWKLVFVGDKLTQVYSTP